MIFSLSWMYLLLKVAVLYWCTSNSKWNGREVVRCILAPPTTTTTTITTPTTTTTTTHLKQTDAVVGNRECCCLDGGEKRDNPGLNADGGKGDRQNVTLDDGQKGGRGDKVGVSGEREGGNQDAGGWMWVERVFPTAPEMIDKKYSHQS